MLRIVLIVFALLAVAIIALLLYASTKPDSFRILRKTQIKATPEKVFALIKDFRQWVKWSPWEKMDLTMQKTFSGAESGVGTIYEWEGNKKVGKGRMEILESVPFEKVVIKLDFFAPFEAHNTAQFTLLPQGDTTEITWEMFGPSPLISKLMGTFFNMDALIGKDFEAGLAAMKVDAEK
jgi:uncharacterized protein YndB with AHSA1/START domain